MIKFRCSACRWFDQREIEALRDVPQNFGLCRKKYPIIIFVTGHHYGRWPLMDRQDLCAEYQPEVTE
jgi:hypothetical protein